MKGICLYCFLFSFIHSQDRTYLMYVCENLCSKKYAGRGYTIHPHQRERGIENARRFIIQEIRKIGGLDLEKYSVKSRNFTQAVRYKKLKYSRKIKKPVLGFQANIIKEAKLTINGKDWILGQDFVPDASSPSIDFTGKAVFFDSVHYVNKERGIVLKLEDKLIYSASQEQGDVVVLHIDKHKFIERGVEKSIDCRVQIKAQVEFVQTDNVYAFVPGTVYPDSFIVFSAHYDHLGSIDTVYFPGANDNASGVAVLLDLMKYYQAHPHRYSVAFYFFTGEEIGLLGSKRYTEQPLFDLKRIKVLINMDLMGGGSEGLMVVNGKVFEKEYQVLENINEALGLGLVLKARGKAKNSDHYWFSEGGVKSFFIYSMGDIKTYHSIDDRADGLKFTNYEKWFKLLVNWVREL